MTNFKSLNILKAEDPLYSSGLKSQQLLNGSLLGQQTSSTTEKHHPYGSWNGTRCRKGCQVEKV